MKTPTHMLVGWILSRALPRRSLAKTYWMVAGAALPDAPLVLAGVILGGQSLFASYLCLPFPAFAGAIDRLYFDTPFFVALHHVLHSPVSLALLFGGWFVLGKSTGRIDYRGLWFLAGAASHAVIDLFTHARDGILLFWPLNRTYRFNAGVDQWDMGGTGAVLLLSECALFLCVAAFLLTKRQAALLSLFHMPFPGLYSPCKCEGRNG